MWYLVTATVTATVTQTSDTGGSASSALGSLYREARDAYYRSPSESLRPERPQARCISCLYAAMGGGGGARDDDR